MQVFLRCFVFSTYILLCCVLPVFAEDTVETIIRESSTNDIGASLNIRTNVSGVEVYMNNLYKGIAPLTITDIVPALYSLQLRKEGWEEKSVFVSLKDNTETNLYFELVPLTGFLRINSNIGDVDVYIDGVFAEKIYSTNTTTIEIQEGKHIVELRKFGWNTIHKTVTIYNRFLSELDFEIEKSIFSITSFESHPTRFNPLAPGGLGRTQFNFSVSAPGSAVIEVLDMNNVSVYSESYGNFTTANHSTSWNGRNFLGNPLPEGRYTIQLEASPAMGWQSMAMLISGSNQVLSEVSQLTTVIDNSIFYPIVTTGASGTEVGIPNARLMPKGTTLVSLNGISSFSAISGFSSFPFSFGVAFTPFSIAEFSLRIGSEVSKNNSFNLPYFIGGSAKLSTEIYNMYVAGLLRYTYASAPAVYESFTESGLGVGFVTGYELGNFFFSLSEEAVFGSEQGNIAAFDGHLKSALGIHFQRGIFSTSWWTFLYSPFSMKTINFFGMIETGLEVSVLIPNTTVSPTLGCTYVYSKNNEHNIAIQFGLNYFLP